MIELPNRSAIGNRFSERHRIRWKNRRRLHPTSQMVSGCLTVVPDFNVNGEALATFQEVHVSHVASLDADICARLSLTGRVLIVSDVSQSDGRKEHKKGCDGGPRIRKDA